MPEKVTKNTETFELRRSVDEYKEDIRKGFFFSNGLLSEDALNTLDERSISALGRISARIAPGKSENILIKHGLLDESFVVNFLAHADARDSANLCAYALNLLSYFSEDPVSLQKFEYLLNERVISKNLMPLLFSPSGNMLLSMITLKSLTWWQGEISSGRLKAEEINVINFGMNTVFDRPERTVQFNVDDKERELNLLEKLVRRFARPESRSDKTHYILHAFQAREHIAELDAQVREVIPPDTAMLPRVALEQLFEFYGRRSPEWRKVVEREQISDGERQKSIQSVNARQEAYLRAKGKFPTDARFSDASHRCFDLYARLDYRAGAGDMDQFQLAIIAKTVEWYIASGRSRLFDRVRIVPANRVLLAGKGISPEMYPWGSKLAAASAEFLNVSGKSFTDSMTFANRFFLTHSNAKEATRMGSMPLFTWSTFQNIFKRPLRNTVLFRGMFNPDDPARLMYFPLAAAKKVDALRRGGPDAYRRADAAGNIAYLIDETLRTIQELEEKEISRAAVDSPQ